MTVIEKLSDRGNFVYEAIKLVLINKGEMSMKQLQWELFQCGVYVKKPLLEQALSVLNEKGLTHKQKANAELVQEKPEAGV